jgi:peptidoglycan/xylan/chitin deacetylase (PgdA/CDA1 family)
MILMYHDISEGRSPGAVPVNEFRKQMEYLKNCGKYDILSLDQYVDNLTNAVHENPIAITFDDGYVSLKTLVLPVIKEYRIPIAIFIPVKHVGLFNAWDIENGHPRIDILDWELLAELSREELVTIGSHGLNHVSHGDLDEEADFHEISKSKEMLEDQLGIEATYYAFPYGQIINIGKYSIDHIKKAGYKAALSTFWSRKNSVKNLYSLNRLYIDGTETMDRFINKLESKIDTGFYIQKLKNVLFVLGILK